MKSLIPKLKSQQHLLLTLMCIWLVTFVFHERFLPNFSAMHCHWPVIDDPKDDVRVLLIADPQLIDNHTYPGRNELLLSLSKHTVDTYLKKNYKSLLNHLGPDYIFWLGDLLDNGRESTDAYYEHEVSRFKKIFYNDFTDRYVSGTNWFANVPGNHDIGFGNGVDLANRARFQSTFGKSNTIRSIHGVDFVTLDTLSLSSKLPAVSNDVKEFINTLNSVNPRILLTHVPLYRTPGTECGPLRESAYFDVEGHGYQYKNALEPFITKSLLQQVRPELIFSGDDHDYCDVEHQSAKSTSREITLKSISMAMGIRYPAVQLLTFKKDSKTLSYQTEICYLPTPYYNIINYVVLSVVSGLIIILWNLKKKYPQSLLPTYKKVSNFLSQQDNETSTQITPSLYQSKSSPKSVRDYAQKYNIAYMGRHCALLAVMVILLYSVFCFTL